MNTINGNVCLIQVEVAVQVSQWAYTMKAAHFVVETEETTTSVRYQEAFERKLGQIRRIITSSGWLDKCIDGQPV